MPSLIELAPARKVPAARPDNLNADLELHGHKYRDAVLHAPPITHGTFHDAFVHVAPGGIVITDAAGRPDDGVHLVAPPSSTEAILDAAVSAPMIEIADPNGVCLALPARGRGNFSHLLLEGLPMPIFDALATGLAPRHVLIETTLATVARGVLAHLAPGACVTACGPVARFRINEFRALNGLKHPMNLADPVAADAYRDIARTLSAGTTGPERIAILRKPGRRGVTNHAEISAMLDARGFTLVSPEDMSFEDQVRTFAHARVVVGVHGAGLSSMVFCLNPETVLVELGQRHHSTPAFWFLARGLGFGYSLVPEPDDQPAPPVRGRPAYADAIVSPDRLTEALNIYR